MKALSALKAWLIDIRLMQKGIGWYGQYKTWQEAEKVAGSYSQQKVFEGVKEATFKVLAGEATFERDGQLFYQTQHNYPLLSALFLAQLQAGSKSLQLTDFGGALGSTWYQHRHLLRQQFNPIKWCVVEQDEFVRMGKKHFSNDILSFHHSLDQLKTQGLDKGILLLSSVLQYLPEPLTFLENLKNYNFQHLVIDYTPWRKQQASIMVQKSKYQGLSVSYPCHFLNQDEVFRVINQSFELVFSFESDLYAYLHGHKLQYYGALWRRK